MTPFFRNRAGQTHFYAIAATGLLALLPTLFVTAYFIERDIELTRRLADDQMPKAILVDRLLVEDLRAVVELLDGLLEVGTRRQQPIDSSTGHIRAAEEALQLLEQTTQLPQGRELVRQTRLLRTDFLAQRAALLRAVREADLDRPIAPQSEPFRGAINAMVDARDRYHEKVDELKSYRQQVVRQTAIDAVASAIRAEWMLVAAWLLAAATLLASGIHWRRRLARKMESKNAEIDRLAIHRDTLVREVHHRIKNHLQGVLGMIEERQRKLPGRAGDFDALLGHLLSLAAVHGLQAKHVSEEVPIAELIRQQIALYQRSRGEVDLKFDAGDTVFSVQAADAVPLALVVTELLINAAKHNGDPVHPRIAMRLWQDGQCAQVHIANPVKRRIELDLATGTGVGTGLSLVKSMLFDLGELTTQWIGDEFVASLRVYHQPSPVGGRTE